MIDMLTGTRDQALLVMLIQEITLAYSSSAKRSYCNKRELSDLLICLAALGVSSGYHFNMHHNRCYSEKRNRELELLALDKAVANPTQHGSKYMLGVNAYFIFKKHAAELEKYRGLIRAVVEFTTAKLDALVTLDRKTDKVYAQYTKLAPPNHPVDRKQVATELNDVVARLTLTYEP